MTSRWSVQRVIGRSAFRSTPPPGSAPAISRRAVSPSSPVATLRAARRTKCKRHRSGRCLRRSSSIARLHAASSGTATLLASRFDSLQMASWPPVCRRAMRGRRSSVSPPTFVVRMVGVPPNVESVLRKAIQGVEPTLIARRARIGDDYLREALAPTRFAMGLLAAFAVIALVLSAVGLYGVIAYGVTQRTREIGVRVALGAEPHAILGMVIGGGIRLASGGVIIGIAIAAGTSRALASMLYGVSPADPWTFAAVALLVAVIAILASYVPARRALRIEPTDALRAD